MRRSKKKILLIVLLLILMGTAWYFREDLTFEAIKQNKETLQQFVDAHYMLSVALFIGINLLTAFFLPGALVLTLIAGFLFGVVLGTVYVVIAMTFGGSLALLFARYLAGNWIHAKYEARLEKFNKEIAQHGSSYLLMMIVTPVLPFFAVNYLVGMSKMSLKRFILTTAVGVLPGAVIYTYAGKQLANISSVHDMMTPKLFVAFLLLGILALLPVFLRLFEKRFSHEHRDDKEG